MSSTVLRSSRALCHLTLVTALWHGYIIYAHFTEDETEAWRRWDFAQEHKARKWQSQVQMPSCSCPLPTGTNHLQWARTHHAISHLQACKRFCLWEALLSNLHPANCYLSFRTHLESPFQETFLDIPSLKSDSSSLDLLSPTHGRPRPISQHLSHSAIQSWAAQSPGPFHIPLWSSRANREMMHKGIISIALVSQTNE